MRTAVGVRPMLACLLVLGGCSTSQAVHDDLTKATSDALAATRTSRLAFTLLDRGDIGRPQAQTVFVDMTRELVTVQRSVVLALPAEPDQQTGRDQVLRALHSAELAVLSGRDCLRTEADCRPARDRLAAADEELTSLTRDLGGGS